MLKFVYIKNKTMPKRSGRKSESQTIAPKKDRIYGSKLNPKGSASSEKSAKTINLSSDIIIALTKKLKEFKENHPNKKNVGLGDLKAVYRRGLGAYSSTHRPTISGGKPNTRNAWAMARVNAFLRKASGGEYKKAYVQDDDLLKFKNGAIIENEFDDLNNNELIKVLKSFYDDFSNSQIFDYLGLQDGNYTFNLGDNEFVIYKDSNFTNIEKIKFGRFIQPYFSHTKKPLYSRFFDRYKIVGKNIIITLKDMYKDGGELNNFFKWYIDWYKGICDRMCIIISIPNEISGLKSVPYKEDNVAILDLFEKIDQSINAKPYLRQILDKADEYGITIYLFPEPRYNNIKDAEHKKKITRKYLIDYYKNFGFELTPDKEFMKRLPKYKDGGELDECIDYIRDNEVIFDNGYYFDMHELSNIIDPYGQVPLNLDFTLVSYNSGGQKNLGVLDTINSMILVDKISDLCSLTKSQSYVVVNYFIDKAKRLNDIEQIKTEKIVIVDRDRIVCENLNSYADGGEVDDHKETYAKWKSLVNMSKSELERFYNSEEGKVAGLKPSEAKAQGIDSGRESARWIMKMKDTNVSDWTPQMWRWAKKQISFISRMSGNQGGLYDDKGRKTRKHLSLLIWGNNPEKKNNGGMTQTFENKFGKRKWINLNYKDLEDYKDEIFDIISNSYSHIGGHLEIQKAIDLTNSDLDFWIANDIDTDPYIDVAIGGKKTKDGIKLTTMAQDGNKASKMYLLKKVVELVQQKGFYSETSKELADKLNIPIVKDKMIIQEVVNKPNIKFNDDGSYDRDIHGKRVTKVLVGVFGRYADGGATTDIRMMDTIGRINDPHFADISYYKKGGENIKFNDIVIYYEKQGNFIIPKGTFYAWLYDEKDAGDKISSGEYDFILFPMSGGLSLAMQKGYVPPLLKIWKKDFQKNKKGIEHLLGIVQGYYDEKENKLYIEMMTTNPKFRRMGVNAHIIKQVREEFEVSQDDVIFDKPTDMGKKFMASKKFDEGGTINKQSNINIMDEIKFNQLPHIDTISKGDDILIRESVFHGNINNPKHLGERYIHAKVLEKGGMLDSLNLKVLNSVGANAIEMGSVITRPIANVMNKGRKLVTTTKFKEGGINPDNKQVKNYFAHGSGNVGGVLVGKRHSEGGIKAINKGTGQPLEMEGGEVVITRGAVSNPKKYDFNGKEMTTREILSSLNVDGGGVSFAEGGDVPDKMNCGCNEMKLGGDTMSMQDFVNHSEKEYQEYRLEKGIEKEKKDHYDTLSKLNAGSITLQEALKQIAQKEMKIDSKYPFVE